MTEEADVTRLKAVTTFSGLLSDRVYQVLRMAILSLDFAPGAIIRKGPICERLGISRSPVSDALRKLAADGLVEVIPQSATRVAKLSMRAIRDESFIRSALETAAVAEAAMTRTEEQLTRLSRNLRMQGLLLEDQDFAGFFQCDAEFHTQILEMSGITRLPATVESLSLQVHRARQMLLPEPGRSAETVTEHAQILNALSAADPEAAKEAMAHHLAQLITRIEPLEKDRPEMFIA